MSKGTKSLIIVVLILAAISVAGFYGNKNGWFAVNKTATVSTQDSAEKARADKAEAELKKMKDQKAADEKKIAEAIESINRMQKMIADMNQPPADQIATPIAAAPADSTATTPVQKKKSGVGG